MALTQEKKQNIIAEFATKPKDTGSPEVQVALLTKQIERLVEHLKVNKKDKHSKKGLLDMISKRKKLIKYLKKVNYEGYQELIKRLGLRK
jgi:small subunit ribosomal protein S15